MGLGLVLWTLLALGCTQEADLKPRLDAVTPSVLTAGRDGYVILEGRFGVGLAWDEEGPSTDERHRVLFGGKLSPEVHLLAPDRLSARLPEGGLVAGSPDVEVRGPNGLSTLLPGGLCVGAESEISLIAGCTMENTFNVCIGDLATGTMNILLAGAVASTNVVPAFFQALGVAPGYDLSPDAALAVYLSARQMPGDKFGLDLRFGPTDKPSAHELVVSRECDEGQNDLPISFPTISPDGKRLVYIQDFRQLISHDIDPQSGELGPARLVIDAAEDGTESTFQWLDVDPSSRRALLTRLVPLGEDCWKEVFGGERAELWVVDLDSGGVILKSRPDNPCHSDGPGVFHPAGDRIVFISNRDGRLLAAPFGSLMNSNSVYMRGLNVQGEITNLLRYQTAFFIGPPSLSADGRFVGLTGYLSDLSGYGWDALVLNVSNGWAQRLVNEAVSHCSPAMGECDPGERFGEDCCNEAGDCCDPVVGSNCPTLDFSTAFYPDGKHMVYNGQPYSWRCGADGLWEDVWAMGIKLLLAGWVVGPDGSGWGVEDLTDTHASMFFMLTSPRFIESPICAQ